ncbi:hypothetical protein EMPG_17446 [Blastomyces silverae]|uniref:Uncharacterized protein n=1 Tax=Blastomyces silverae TaxID=2060906 RepID=A0A0H1B6J8_9EURO|nr:hypothetical protein EMPG_17446 [Blastomyces silverae]
MRSRRIRSRWKQHSGVSICWAKPNSVWRTDPVRRHLDPQHPQLHMDQSRHGWPVRSPSPGRTHVQYLEFSNHRDGRLRGARPDLRQSRRLHLRRIHLTMENAIRCAGRRQLPEPTRLAKEGHEGPER